MSWEIKKRFNDFEVSRQTSKQTIMAQQKLYTEEQVSIAINAAKANPKQAYLILAMLRPIELPSDEEVEQAIFPYMDSLAKAGFIEGAKWVINKILNK